MITVSARNQAQRLIWTRLAGLSLTAWAFVLLAVLGLLGLLWDGAWHASWGRHTFFIPPHNVMYASVTLAIVLAGAIIVSHPPRPGDPTFLRIGPFQAPLGVWAIGAGTYTMIVAAPLDEMYHRAFGLDNGTGLWSPPHFLGMVGGLIAVIGILFLLIRESPPPDAVNGQPHGLSGLNTANVLSLFMLSYIVFIVGGLSLNFYGIRYWYRTDGSLYPLLAVSFGLATLVLAQRLMRRAGTATVIVAIPFVLVGAAGAILSAAGYPVVVSIPVMGLPSALLLDGFYARFGSGYRWLFIAGPLATVLFYVSEYYWAGYLNEQFWPMAGALRALPLAVVAGTASLVVGAWLAERVARWERLGLNDITRTTLPPGR